MGFPRRLFYLRSAARGRPPQRLHLLTRLRQREHVVLGYLLRLLRLQQAPHSRFQGRLVEWPPPWKTNLAQDSGF